MRSGWNGQPGRPRRQSAPNDPDVVEVKLSSFAVQSPRRFGDCWTATQLWSDLGLDGFWRDALADEAGDVPWEKVLELLAVNRLLAPRSELSIHEKWFPQTAMDGLLDTDGSVGDTTLKCCPGGRTKLCSPVISG